MKEKLHFAGKQIPIFREFIFEAASQPVGSPFVDASRRCPPTAGGGSTCTRVFTP